MKTLALALCALVWSAGAAPPSAAAANTVRCLKLSQELSFGAYGGAELFFVDLDRDGRPEVLAYQGPGVFGARLYSGLPQVKPALPKSTCLTAFRQDGTRWWTWGTPNPAIGDPRWSPRSE